MSDERKISGEGIRVSQNGIGAENAWNELFHVANV
jgi:hypothetical protein